VRFIMIQAGKGYGMVIFHVLYVLFLLMEYPLLFIIISQRETMKGKKNKIKGKRKERGK